MITFVSFIAFLAASAVSEPLVKPTYSPEVVENLDVSHILHDIFENNGEDVDNYLDLSQFTQTPETEEPELPDELDLLAENLPGDLLSTPGIIRYHGYPCEEHFVTTRDGYILGMHRIPSSPFAPADTPRRAPVYLQHGLLDSSATWVLAGRERGLAFILSDLGHDVWLGNYRGNRFSRNHTTFNPDGWRTRLQFWSFSWHEMGIEDIPAMIDYVLENNPDYEKLHYVGHSQGTTAFFVMASERPEYNDKIYAMNALAPVAFMGNMEGLAGRAMGTMIANTETGFRMFGQFEFAPNDSILNSAAYHACKIRAVGRAICRNVLFLAAGFNPDDFDQNLLPIIIRNTPAGAAVRQIAHYGQGMQSGRFGRFDHGLLTNLRVYGSRRPPNYPLGNIRCPVNLAYSLNDYMAAVVDVRRLSELLPNVVSLYQVSHPRFNHLDFTWGLRAKELVYDHVIDIINRAENGEFE